MSHMGHRSWVTSNDPFAALLWKFHCTYEKLLSCQCTIIMPKMKYLVIKITLIAKT